MSWIRGGIPLFFLVRTIPLPLGRVAVRPHWAALQRSCRTYEARPKTRHFFNPVLLGELWGLMEISEALDLLDYPNCNMGSCQKFANSNCCPVRMGQFRCMDWLILVLFFVRKICASKHSSWIILTWNIVWCQWQFSEACDLGQAK